MTTPTTTDTADTTATTATDAFGPCHFCEKPTADGKEGMLCDTCMAKYRELRDSEIDDLRIEVNQAISAYQQ